MASTLSSSKKKQKIINLLLRDGTSCAYCSFKFNKVEHITIDHVIPKLEGGSNGNINLVLSCNDCNSKKGSMLLTQFIRAYDIKVTRLLDKFL